MKLTPEEEAMLAGKRGWPLQLAMELLVAVGRACDADRLIPVRSAHIVIDAVPLGEAGAALMERLAAEQGRFTVPTTINAIVFDRREGGASALDSIQRRALDAAERMGAIATCSCNPTAQGQLPAVGESVAWSESAAAPFLNGAVGARTNREGASALASALTGLTPRYGMHDTDRRKGEMLIELRAEVSGVHGWGLLGAAVGHMCGERIPVLVGAARPDRDALVAFGASLAMHAPVAMYHIVGTTPEAPTVEVAFGGPPPRAVPLGEAELAAAVARLSSGAGDRVAVVCVGCPHASFDQLREVAERVGTRRVAENVRFFVHTGRVALAEAERAGLADRLRAAGVTLTADKLCWACGRVYPAPPESATVATNSAKLAFLAPATWGARVRYGDVAHCVEAAITGSWPSHDGETPWS